MELSPKLHEPHPGVGGDVFNLVWNCGYFLPCLTDCDSESMRNSLTNSLSPSSVSSASSASSASHVSDSDASSSNMSASALNLVKRRKYREKRKKRERKMASSFGKTGEKRQRNSGSDSSIGAGYCEEWVYAVQDSADKRRSDSSDSSTSCESESSKNAALNRKTKVVSWLNVWRSFVRRTVKMSSKKQQSIDIVIDHSQPNNKRLPSIAEVEHGVSETYPNCSPAPSGPDPTSFPPFLMMKTKSIDPSPKISARNPSRSNSTNQEEVCLCISGSWYMFLGFYVEIKSGCTSQLSSMCQRRIHLVIQSSGNTQKFRL